MTKTLWCIGKPYLTMNNTITMLERNNQNLMKSHKLAEEESYSNIANLNESEITYQIRMFNEYLESVIQERYEECMDSLRDFAEQYEEFDNPFTHLDFDFDLENEWVDYVCNVSEWTRDEALSVYRSGYGLNVYDDDDICQYIYDNYDNVDDVGCGCCLVYLKSPDEL